MRQAWLCHEDPVKYKTRTKERNGTLDERGSNLQEAMQREESEVDISICGIYPAQNGLLDGTDTRAQNKKLISKSNA